VDADGPPDDPAGDDGSSDDEVFHDCPPAICSTHSIRHLVKLCQAYHANQEEICQNLYPSRCSATIANVAAMSGFRRGRSVVRR
jgi:hypothetical protein